MILIVKYFLQKSSEKAYSIIIAAKATQAMMGPPSRGQWDPTVAVWLNAEAEFRRLAAANLILHNWDREMGRKGCRSVAKERGGGRGAVRCTGQGCPLSNRLLNLVV